MSERLRIIVTGLAASYPFGGVFWDYAQYLLGFHRLGHDVLYVEDTGRWAYDPRGHTFVEDGSDNAARFETHLARLEPALRTRWFYRDGGSGKTFGRSWEDVVEWCLSADLFLNISASCWMREEYKVARRIVYIDSDPLYTQASIPGYLDRTATAEERGRVEMFRRSDALFSFGERIGKPDCGVPVGELNWIPTRQPIVLDAWESAVVPVKARRRVLTTVASWEPAEQGPVIDGVTYFGKSREFRRFIDLPRHSALTIELALSGPAPRDELRAHGWQIIDPLTISLDPWSYRAYLAESLGEWSVAKNAYVASRSGWFSCRSACYLALGVPAIVQETGFGELLPTGEGLLAFSTLDEARDAIAAVAADPARHARAAAELAAEHFDAAKVLTRLLAAL